MAANCQPKSGDVVSHTLSFIFRWQTYQIPLVFSPKQMQVQNFWKWKTIQHIHTQSLSSFIASLELGFLSISLLSRCPSLSSVTWLGYFDSNIFIILFGFWEVQIAHSKPHLQIYIYSFKAREFIVLPLSVVSSQIHNRSVKIFPQYVLWTLTQYRYSYVCVCVIGYIKSHV